MNHKNQQPHYGMRKLSVGFVSCLLGFTLIAGLVPGTVYASGAKKPLKRSNNRTIVEHQVLGHHGSSGKVDAKSSATSKEEIKEKRESVKYQAKQHRIFWDSYTDHAHGVVNQVWINKTKLKKVDHIQNWKGILEYRNSYCYEKGKIHISEELNSGDIVNIVINGKSNGFKYLGGKDLTPLEDKELFPPKKPKNKIKVDNPSKLSEEDKSKIKEEIKKLNPEADVSISKDNQVILNYPDGSQTKFPVGEVTEEDQAAAEEAAAEKAVSDLEKTGAEITDDKISDAQGKINQVKDQDKKQNLQDRLNKVKEEKAKKDAEAAAEAAAEKAVSDLEKTGAEITDDKISDAQGKIEQVQDQDKKQGLQDRLNKVKDDKAKKDAEAAALAAAEKAVSDLEKPGATVTDEKITDVQALINKVQDENKKKDLQDRLDKVKEEKAKKDAEDEDLADRDEVTKAKKELKTYMKSMDEKVLDSESIEFKGNDRKDAKDAVQKAKDLLAKEKITKKELKFIQSIPYREVNGKKTGLFRKFTKKALVNYKVEGDRDQINPHNNKKYVALKNNEIKIQSNLKGAKKIGENEKAFFKLNYVTNEQYAAHNNVAKPMAVSFRSAQVDAASTATPKYKKQEVPRENYEVKAVDGGYEITIKQLPENVKYIKPIVYVKFADQTYFENGDMVAVTAAVEPNSEDQTPVIPSKPDVSHESGSSSTDSGYIFLEPVATVQRESSKPSEPTKQAEAPKAKHGAYIYGYGDDCFRPNGKISRAEAASMIAYLAGLDMNQKDKANFADTPSAWYNAAINAMVKNNLMLADKNGNFRPNEPITRAEFARALAGIDKKSDRVASFTDVKGHEFEDAINQAFGNGHIVGYPDGTFRPDGAITRAEAVTILNHYDGRSMDKQDLQKIRMNFKSFKDVEERHWAYVQILLAANNFQEMKDALGNR